MCCLFGLIDTRGQYSGAQKSRMLHALATAAEARGTDASGIAYRSGTKKGLVIQKSPVPGGKLRIRVPDDVVTVMGHTRMTTQGSAAKNCNNHPFAGKISGKPFVFAHNGIIYNDAELRERFSLPSTKIETDSYVAVQLLERQKRLDFDSLRFVTEQLEGSLTYTVMDDQDSLFIVKGDNPLSLIRFPKTGLFLYASTSDILVQVLRMCSQPPREAVKININSGEIVKITGVGIATRSRFNDALLYQFQPRAAAYCFPHCVPLRPRQVGGYAPEIEGYLYESQEEPK